MPVPQPSGTKEAMASGGEPLRPPPGDAGLHSLPAALDMQGALEEFSRGLAALTEMQQREQELLVSKLILDCRVLEKLPVTPPQAPSGAGSSTTAADSVQPSQVWPKRDASVQDKQRLALPRYQPDAGGRARAALGGKGVNGVNDETAMRRINTPSPLMRRSNTPQSHTSPSSIMDIPEVLRDVSAKVLAQPRATIIKKDAGVEPKQFFNTDRMIKMADRLMSHCQRVTDEPERTGLLARTLKATWFEVLCVWVIFANAIYLWYDTDYRSQNLGEEPDTFMMTMELAFLTFYAVELLMKMWVHKQYFFCNGEATWNNFDMLLVLLACVDIGGYLVAGGNDGRVNMTYLRMCRFIRVTKMLRVVRAFRFISELRLMLDCIIGCVGSVFWSVCLLGITTYFFAVFFVQSSTNFLMDAALKGGADMNSPEIQSLRAHFGTVNDAMLSLFMSSSGGEDWVIFYNDCALAGFLNTAIFLFYIIIFSLAVMNIVTGIFMDKAMKLNQPTVDVLMAQKQKQDMKDAEDFLLLCQRLDSNQDGVIQIEELKTAMRSREIRAYMECHGLDIKDTDAFFQLLFLAQGEKEVDSMHFAAACMRLKGSASNIDLHMLSHELRTMIATQNLFGEYCAEMLQDLLLSLGMQAPPPPTPDSLKAPPKASAKRPVLSRSGTGQSMSTPRSMQSFRGMVEEQAESAWMIEEEEDLSGTLPSEPKATRAISGASPGVTM